MVTPTLSYGLNLPNKEPRGLAGKKRKKAFFDSDSEDDGLKGDSNEPSEITSLGDLSPSPRTYQSAERSHKSTSNGQGRLRSSQCANSGYINLSAIHSSNKYTESATNLDPTIYDYDAVYDSLHTKSTSSSAGKSSSQTPKYMTSLLRSAEIRKRDQLRARDRLLAREREAEGDEFADKEKFVTEAYKSQQEEVRRIEAEEAAREKEEEERRKKGGGMTGFYRDMLERDEKRHGDMVKAAGEAARQRLAGGKADEEAGKDANTQEKSEAQIAAELNAHGANVILNDEGQVVDKRQLLSAGLNVSIKKKQKASPESTTTPDARVWPGSSSRASEIQSARSAQRARQTDLLAAQLEERMRRDQEEEEAQKRELVEKNKSRKTAAEVMSARERYLARKKEREKERAT